MVVALHLLKLSLNLRVKLSGATKTFRGIPDKVSTFHGFMTTFHSPLPPPFVENCCVYGSRQPPQVHSDHQNGAERSKYIVSSSFVDKMAQCCQGSEPLCRNTISAHTMHQTFSFLPVLPIVDSHLHSFYAPN